MNRHYLQTMELLFDPIGKFADVRRPFLQILFAESTLLSSFSSLIITTHDFSIIILVHYSRKLSQTSPLKSSNLYSTIKRLIQTSHVHHPLSFHLVIEIPTRSGCGILVISSKCSSIAQSNRESNNQALRCITQPISTTSCICPLSWNTRSHIF